ncbi:phosphoketolase family protein [Streptococcus agalactiae]|nr:phosphoketolase family protein [Streptococcus agalactiae]MCC9982305.1 phosphoketolase family protein [Streptococcus agalactiae]MCC9987255.1 phosphoketolase family protein [Streptococcus agalactiae]MCC9990144.1 phosphoketolase family protein [Streptococcus agalactiae]MCC9994290.1 phosphoketolase family protein [Streptococcus agalactiae]
MMSEFDTKSYLEKLDAWWRAANYISAAQMYLKDNPLLRRELVENDLKVHPIGHWGTVPGQNFIYAHLNRAINKYDLDMFYIEGPGHGGQVMVSNSYLDGSYTELNPNIEQTEDGFKQLCKIFSFPGGIASHAAPETPGSIHEGGELGYALSHATGAILDNPDVIAATVIGDGEGETGPLMAGWLSNTFINPVNDGAVLPIFYLNGGKIHNPTIFERKTDEELSQFFEGLGWKPIFADVVELSEDHAAAHALFAEKLDQAIQEIKTIQSEARQKPAEEAIQAKFPVLVARIPKGWTGPKAWEGTSIEGGFRAHQVPIPVDANPDNFRIFGPDETKSNRLQEVFTRTSRQWLGRRKPDYDEALSPAGRVIDSQLSEHQAEGFLEGYVLTGRHGFFASYESFLRVVESMVTQHFKWLRKSKTHTTWRKNYPALNLIAASTVFQQDHNGYTHQDPGILTHLAEKTPEYIREYLPADTNSLLAVMDKAFKAEDKINLIVTSKHPRPQFYSIAEAEELVAEGYKVIDWASNVSLNQEPDVVFAAAGTEPNLEALAAISILHKAFPELKIRFVNVLDILKLRHPSQDARGLSDEEFNKVFTTDKPVIFAFHGYEDMIRDIFFSRHNHNLHTHGYRENGDITTPFDMRVMSELDRFHLAQDAALASLGNEAQAFSDEMNQMVAYHKDYIREHGDDIPEVQNWKWENIK